MHAPGCPAHGAVPDRFCAALRLCISDVLSLTRQVDSSVSPAQALHDDDRVQPAVQEPGVSQPPGVCATDVRSTSQPREGNRLINASFPPPWFMLSATAVFRRHFKPLQQLSGSPRIGIRQPAGFPSLGPNCLPPTLDMLHHQTTILVSRSHCSHALSSLSDYLASCVGAPCLLLAAPLDKLESPARLAIVCTLPLAAPAGAVRATNPFW